MENQVGWWKRRLWGGRFAVEWIDKSNFGEMDTIDSDFDKWLSVLGSW
jgi:hypothetical protein